MKSFYAFHLADVSQNAKYPIGPYLVSTFIEYEYFFSVKLEGCAFRKHVTSQSARFMSKSASVAAIAGLANCYWRACDDTGAGGKVWPTLVPPKR